MVSPTSSAPLLSTDALRTLLAFGWVDGGFDASEREVVRDIARQAGLTGPALSTVEAATEAPVDFEEIDTLPRDEALVVYGLAYWVGRADGTLDPLESRALVALGYVLTITANQRAAIHGAVENLIEEGDDDRVDLSALQGRIHATMPTPKVPRRRA
jgi:tellurite resistance protein